MEIRKHSFMIHPNIQDFFPDNKETLQMFSEICNHSSKKNKELSEFIKWHQDTNKQVIEEIVESQKINFEDKTIGAKWAENFLSEYDEKIRKMRNTSNMVFERFHILKKTHFEKSIFAKPENKIKITKIMNIFLNKEELLIGKIIFSYRELWFLAKHINEPEFQLGTIIQYRKWVDANITNLKKLDKSLEMISGEIKKWKE